MPVPRFPSPPPPHCHSITSAPFQPETISSSVLPVCTPRPHPLPIPRSPVPHTPPLMLPSQPSPTPEEPASSLTPHLHRLAARHFALLYAPNRPSHPPLSLPLAHVPQFITHALSNPKWFHLPSYALDLLSLALIPNVWPTSDLSSLRTAAGPAASSGVCGYVWKGDELAYKCRTCERDPTCVVCVPCFRRADHVGHDYAMVRTTGGCCDCGDIQAWRREGFCSAHKGACSEHDDPAALIPSDLRARLSFAVDAVARTTLFLIAQLHCLVLKLGSERIVTIRRVAAMLSWLNRVVCCGDGIRRAVTLILIDTSVPHITNVLCQPGFDKLLNLSKENISSQSWLSLVLRMDGVDRLPDVVSQSLHELYFQLINDLIFKRDFFKLIVANYERYIHASVAQRYDPRDTYESSSRSIDILENFTVQLFTVPALIPVMIERGGLLDVLLNILLNLFEVSSSPVRAYVRDIPFEKTSFAAKYPAMIPVMKWANESITSVARRTSSSGSTPFVPPQISSSLSISQMINSAGEGCPGDSRILSQFISNLLCNLRRDRESSSSSQGNIEDRNETSTPADISVQTDVDHEELQDHSMTPINGDDVIIDEFDDIVSSPEPAEEQNDSDDPPPPQDDEEEDGHPQEAMHLMDQEMFEVVADAIDLVDDAIEVYDVGEEDELSSIALAFLRDLTNMEITAMEFDNDIQNSLGAVDEDAENQFNMQLMKAFEDGLNFVPATHAKMVSTNPPHSQFRTNIANARKMTKASTNGSWPITHPLRLDLSERQYAFTDALIWKVMKDLHFVLSHEAVAFHLIHEREDSFRLFLRLMSMAQGMNPSIRRFGDHVLSTQDTWTKTFMIEIEFYRLVDALIAVFYAQDGSEHTSNGVGVGFTPEKMKQSRQKAIGMVRQTLDEWLFMEQALEELSTYKDEAFSVSHAVSVHLPLHRLLALFIHHSVQIDGEDVARLLGQEGQLATAEDAQRLLIHPLRIQSFFAQVRAGMWKRNGQPVSGQAAFYSSMFCSEWFVDLDLFIQQCCAVLLGPEGFLKEVRLAFRFGDFAAVMDLSHSELEQSQMSNAASASADNYENEVKGIQNAPENNPTSDCFYGLLPLAPRHLAETGVISLTEGWCMANGRSDLAKYCQTLVEEFLVYIVRICSERARCGQTEENLLRLRVVHQLCPRDKLYSNIIRTCSYRTYNKLSRKSESADGEEGQATESVVESILSSIAEFVKPKGMEQGRYRLKDDVWKEFDPFSPYLIRRERCSAEIRRSAVYQRLEKKAQVIPEERICDRDIFPQFLELSRIPLCASGSGSEAVAAIALNKSVPTNGKAASIEGVLPAALHLQCMAVDYGGALIPQDEVLKHVAPVDNQQFMYCGIRAVCALSSSYVKTHPELHSEFSPVIERILCTTFSLGNSAVNDVLRERVSHALSEKLLGSAHEASASSSAISPEERRRQILLRKKKEQQAAALEKMRVAQATFAEHIADEDGNEDDGTESEREGSLAEEEDDSRVSFDTVARAEDGCVLCHGAEHSKGTHGLLCLIGFFQVSSLPYISKQFCLNVGKGDGEGQECFLPQEHPEEADANDTAIPKLGSASTDGSRDPEVFHVMSDSSKDPLWLQSASFARKNMHLSLCGHAVHLACFETYFSTLMHNQNWQSMHFGSNITNPEKDEFLCPVCQRLSNMVLPSVDRFKRKLGLRSGPLRRMRLNPTSSIESYRQWLQRRDTEITAFVREIASSSRDLRGGSERQDGPKRVSDVKASVDTFCQTLLTRSKKVLKRFGLFGTNMDNTAEQSSIGNAASVFGAHSKLACAFASTATCLEIASRVTTWSDSLFSHARRSLRLVFREAREQICLEPETVASGMKQLWFFSRDHSGSGDIDPCAVICFLLILWPSSLTRAECCRLVRVGLDTVRDGNDTAETVDRELRTLLFLRQAAVILGVLFDDEPPLSIYDADLANLAWADEAGGLMRFLDVPTIAAPFAAQREAACREMVLSRSVGFLPVRIGLRPLPHELQRVLEIHDGRLCRACGRRPEEPALCLICGALVCAQRRERKIETRCSGGGMRAHTEECGCGTGVLLVLKRTNVEIIRGERRAQWGSPYLDAHGEEDQVLLRGRPLFLHVERYRVLEKLWILQAFDQDMYVLRNTRLDNDREYAFAE